MIGQQPSGVNVRPGYLNLPIESGGGPTYPAGPNIGESVHAPQSSPVQNEVQHQTGNETGSFTPWTPAPQASDYGGLNWQAFALPAINGVIDTGYTAAAPGGGFYYYGPDQQLYLDTYSGEVHAGDLGNKVSGNVGQFFAQSTPGNPPPAPGGSSGGSSGSSNSGGAGLAGNGPLIDALTQLLAGAGGQNPLDASSSPSTAALEALQPQSGQTSSSGDPAIIILVIGAIVAAGAWFYFKHKKRGAAAPPAAA